VERVLAAHGFPYVVPGNKIVRIQITKYLCNDPNNNCDYPDALISFRIKIIIQPRKQQVKRNSTEIDQPEN
jgi:hypothetical protein